MLLGLDLKRRADVRFHLAHFHFRRADSLRRIRQHSEIRRAGTLVPITGFANSMVSPALEFKSEGFVTGLGAKLFTVAGPVLVFGISASVLYGIVLYIIGLF